MGLLSEEVDPQSGELLGNYPQAFGHIELVNAPWAISQAEQAVRASAAVDGSPVKAIAVFPGQASKLHLRNVHRAGAGAQRLGHIGVSARCIAATPGFSLWTVVKR